MKKHKINPKELKVCKECEQEKPKSEYYRHDHMWDGLLSMCKECKRKFVKEHRDLDIEKSRIMERDQYLRRKQRGKRKCTGRRKTGMGNK